MGVINTPWDLVVLVLFGIAMFVWGYRSALRPGEGLQPVSDSAPVAVPGPVAALPVESSAPRTSGTETLPPTPTDGA